MPVSKLGPIYDPLRNRGVPALPFLYIGFVKRNDDAQRMGRLSIWIPDLGGAPDDPGSWIIASYISPFAGATNIDDIANYENNPNVGQQSYGFWAVPPDLNCEVAVLFAGGDLSRAYYIGGTFQQNMTHMIPGIAVNVTTEPSPPIHVSPVVEYNKADKQMNVDSPRRPPFFPLTNGLHTEGLETDNERGSSSTSARREAPSKVFGMLSPRGNTIHIDDNEPNEFIRLRTRSGAQVLIHETSGYVYINSKNGNSWFEISDAGIDAYSANSISLRAQGDLNIRADRSIRLDAGEDIQMKAGQNITMEAGNNWQVKIAKDTNILSDHNMDIGVNNDLTIDTGNDIQIGCVNNMVLSATQKGSFKTGDELNVNSGTRIHLESSANMDLKAGANLRTQSSGNTSLKAGGKQFRDGSAIHDNTGGSPAASPAPALAAKAHVDPTMPKTQAMLDTSSRLVEDKLTWRSSGSISNNITMRMPTHEPWSEHPRSNVPPPPLEEVPIDYQPTYGDGNPNLSALGGSDAAGGGGGSLNEAGCSFGAANTKPCSSEVYNAIAAAADKTGCDRATMLAFADAESSFQPGVSAKTSSASGLFQFTSGTWGAMVGKYGSKYNVSSDQINDARSNAMMGGQFIQDNSAILNSNGITKPTAGQLYIMHFLGSGGGPKLIQAAQAQPNADAASLFPAAARANASIFSGKTVGQVYQNLTAKMDSKAQAYATQYGLTAPCERSQGVPGPLAAGSPASGTPSSTPSSVNPVAAVPSNFEQYKGQWIGDRECVTFVQRIGKYPRTVQWKPGDPPTASTPIGTALATFHDGRYPQSDKNPDGTRSSRHAGFFAGMMPGNHVGFYLVDQWNAANGAIGTHSYRYNAGGVQNANLYRTINL